METVTDFIFLGSKITADGDFIHEIKRFWLLGRKALTNIDSMLKSRDITLPTKVCLVSLQGANSKNKTIRIKIKSHIMSIVKVQSVAPVHFRVVRCHQMKKSHHI